jgi:PAS domain-containing protein
MKMKKHNGDAGVLKRGGGGVYWKKDYFAKVTSESPLNTLEFEGETNFTARMVRAALSNTKRFSLVQEAFRAGLEKGRGFCEQELGFSFKEMLFESPTPTSILDNGLNGKFVNKAFTSLFETDIFPCLWDFVRDRDRKTLEGEMKAILRVETGSGKSHVFLTMLKQSGGFFPGEVKFSLLERYRSAKGLVCTVENRSVLTDVGEVFGLRVGELARLGERLPMPVLMKDQSGKFFFANPAFCEQLQVNPKQILGKTDFNFYPKELAKKYLEDDQYVLSNHSCFEGFEWHKPPKRPRHLVQVLKMVVFDDNGLVVGVMGAFWPASQRELMLGAIRSVSNFAHFKCERLLSGRKFGYYESSIQGAILRVNDTFASMLGYKDEGSVVYEIRNMAKQLYCGESKRMSFVNRMLTSPMKFMEENFEVWKTNQDGTRETIEVRERARAVTGPDGEVKFVAGSIREIASAFREGEMLK